MTCNQPHLGLATTRELLDELRARFEIHAAGGLDYRTVPPEPPAAEPATGRLADAAIHILNTFRKDEADGFRSRDRQFAITILEQVLSPDKGEK